MTAVPIKLSRRETPNSSNNRYSAQRPSSEMTQLEGSEREPEWQREKSPREYLCNGTNRRILKSRYPAGFGLTMPVVQSSFIGTFCRGGGCAY